MPSSAWSVLTAAEQTAHTLASVIGSLDARHSWREQAACRGVDTAIFFEGGRGSRLDPRALAICDGCPVRAECLEFAVELRIKRGVWGGTTPAERRRLPVNIAD